MIVKFLFQNGDFAVIGGEDLKLRSNTGFNKAHEKAFDAMPKDAVGFQIYKNGCLVQNNLKSKFRNLKIAA